MDQTDKKLLDDVIAITGDVTGEIDTAVRKVIGRAGIPDRARRIYLFGKLKRLAKGKIRRARAKVARYREQEAAVV